MAGTIIGDGLVVEGEVLSDDEVLVHGTLRGKLRAQEVVSVAATGLVEADITGTTLNIAGQVTGDVVASERVDLQAGGRLVGDVKAARLTIADGAVFKGTMDMGG
jgi:cytoskeletal protein CcmA (bactofilin family)